MWVGKTEVGLLVPCADGSLIPATHGHGQRSTNVVELTKNRRSVARSHSDKEKQNNQKHVRQSQVQENQSNAMTVVCGLCRYHHPGGDKATFKRCDCISFLIFAEYINTTIDLTFDRHFSFLLRFHFSPPGGYLY